MTPHYPTSTVVSVLFRTRTVHLDHLPSGTPVVLVHNDRTLDPSAVTRPGVTHLLPDSNLGFGGGVNLALQAVTTKRVLLVNPDVYLEEMHWRSLLDGTPDELRTISLDAPDGSPTSTINRYPTPLGLVLSGYRVGRFLQRGSALRRIASRVGGSYARSNAESLLLREGTWSLGDRWASGAVLGLDTRRMREIGGFDDEYFLYYEDVDLCRRLADRFPVMKVVLVAGPGIHEVGGSAAPGGEVERARLNSAVRYADGQPGWRWAITTHLLRLRQRWI